jgi:cation diffusion facilitator family transporter
MSAPAPWEHDHTLGQDQVRHGERRTLIVAALTAAFMVVEVTAGVALGSMALLADGLHMGSHAVALGIAVSAYVYARRRARDERFSFGTGKVNALGGFTGALLLAVFAAFMAWESAARFLHPVAIVFDQAIVVAVVGLVVNGVSALLLGHEHEHDHEHDDHEHEHEHDDHEHDHNLRAARLHVLADALTSILALGALLGGKYLDQVWLDPAMGIVGAILVARWSVGLLRQSSAVLLDHQAPAPVRARLRAALEKDDARVVDLHLWSIGPGVRAASVTLVAREPLSPAAYKARVPADLRIGHVTLELHEEPS